MSFLPHKEDLSRLVAGFGSIFSLNAYLELKNFLASPIKLYTAVTSVPNDKLTGVNFFSGAGSSLNVEKAFLSCLGEMYERYSLCQLYSEQKVKEFSLADKSPKINALSELEFNQIRGIHSFQYHLSQNRFEPLRDTTSLRWIRAARLVSEEEIWIPEALVVLRAKRDFVCEVTTNGCALSASKEDAIVKAYLELIERDSFMYFWWRKEDPQFVDFRADLFQLDPKLYQAYGPWIENINIIYTTGDLGVPTFFAVFSSENEFGQPAFAVAGASHLNPLKAMQKALTELATILNFNLNSFMKRKSEFGQSNSNFDMKFLTFQDHVFHYMFDDAAKTIFFYSQLKRPKFTVRLKDISNLEKSTAKDDLNFLKELCKKNKRNPIVVDQTPSDIADLGYYVMRVIDKDLIDLNPTHASRRWGKERLFDNRISTVFDLNQFPHPYP